MSIQSISISTGVQSTEQYKTHKQTQPEQTEQEIKEIKQVDEYDKANKAGEEVEGIYSVSHDDEGNLKVDYRQPGSAKSAGAAPAQVSNSQESGNEDDNEEEIEKLKQQRDAIKQQLNREKDENIKAALRTQLQSIEMQIALKSRQ